jgi:hypothetical protein
MSSQIGDRVVHPVDVISEFPETGVAVEAQYPAHSTGRVIVVDMLRVKPSAYRANPTLVGKKLAELGLTDPVPMPQVVLPRAAV